MAMRRARMSWSEGNELWRRWRAGESLVDIARALERERTGVGAHVTAAGGIAPPARRRSRLALTTDEREEISRGIARHETVRGLARRLQRAPSTISREIPPWRAPALSGRARGPARVPGPPAQGVSLGDAARLRRLVAAKLARQWSPQQITGWLRRTYPGDPDRQVSHETIYRSLFVQSRGVLKQELAQHTAAARAAARPGRDAASATTLGISSTRSRFVNARRKPNDRAVPGHWEGDLLMGARRASQVTTLVERHSRYVMLVRINVADTQTVVARSPQHVRRFPPDCDAH